MTPGQIIVLGILLFSVFLGWSFSRGRTAGVRLYLLSVTVAISLLAGAVSQLVSAAGAVESLNIIAIALSLAALPSGPTLWEEQIREDLEHTRLYGSLEPADLLSWKAWLKLVDRLGAARAALGYLGIYAAAILAAALAIWQAGPGGDRGFATVVLLIPAMLAALSAAWLYRAARRLVPGA